MGKIIYKKEFFKIIVLVILSLILILLFLEIAFRIIHPIKFETFISYTTRRWLGGDAFLNTKIARSSNTLGYEWIPGSECNSWKINSLGMLDKERSIDKPKDVYRIICLGDSTTANSEYVKILEGLLNKNIKAKKFEVWNCGVTGYNAIQYCRALQGKWIKYNPDMVIIGFCLNDFSVTPLVTKERDTVVGYFPHKEISSTVNPFLLKNSALYRFIVMRILFKNNLNSSDEDTTKSVSSNLNKTKKLLATKDISFLLVILGVSEPLKDWKQHLQTGYAQIREIINYYNIESLDTVPIFLNNNPSALKAMDQEHFNEKGSQLVAQAIYDYIQQNADKLRYSQ